MFSSSAYPVGDRNRRFDRHTPYDMAGGIESTIGSKGVTGSELATMRSKRHAGVIGISPSGAPLQYEDPSWRHGQDNVSQCDVPDASHKPTIVGEVFQRDSDWQ